MAEPKIILFDLETIPNVPELLKVYLGLSRWPGKTLKAQITTILCAGWKVWGQQKTHCIRAWDYKPWAKDINNDRAVCEALYEVLESASAVVTHNGKRFDWKFLQTRLVLHNLPVLPPIPHIDTCQIARRHLSMDSNRLGNLGEQLVGEDKEDTGGWELWLDCMKRNQFALNKMERYCKHDVNLLEKVFERLRPLTTNHPNFNLWSRGMKPQCPACGSTRLDNRGYRHTKTSVYKRYRCQDCGSWSRTDAADRLPRPI